MKTIVAMLSLALLAAACGAPSGPNPEPTIKLDPGTATLDATVNKVKVNKGPVNCALFNQADGFPGASPIIGGTVIADPTSDKVKCVFSALPAGSYAITTYQDENSNGKLDTNAFGAPTEGYGASKNNLPAASAPTFEDNKIVLADGQTQTIDINLR